jgi:hypothetical protein
MLLLPLALGGCTSNLGGPSTDPASMAELIVNRTNDRTLRNAKAVIYLNGVRTVDLDNNESFSMSISAGSMLISVSGEPSLGDYSVSFDAEAGKAYRFEVSPRGRGYVPPADDAVPGFRTTESEGPFKLLPEAPSSRSR